jgi:hypothetical protein
VKITSCGPLQGATYGVRNGAVVAEEQTCNWSKTVNVAGNPHLASKYVVNKTMGSPARRAQAMCSQRPDTCTQEFLKHQNRYVNGSARTRRTAASALAPTAQSAKSISIRDRLPRLPQIDARSAGQANVKKRLGPKPGQRRREMQLRALHGVPLSTAHTWQPAAWRDDARVAQTVMTDKVCPHSVARCLSPKTPKSPPGRAGAEISLF